ncbi:MAG: hypothetical protein GY874_01120 [Desulfobacteraceae bacterium]|nr:hypothetical protein [Desulfobacteraceae bacterium]
MKHKSLIVFAVAVLFITTGVGSAIAGGSSATSGDGFHCYLFFDLGDGEFAQVMVNDSEPGKVEEEVLKAIDKYEQEEAGLLDMSIGNIDFGLPDNRLVCAAAVNSCPTLVRTSQ